MQYHEQKTIILNPMFNISYYILYIKISSVYKYRFYTKL